jgi:hypothetical protein
VPKASDNDTVHLDVYAFALRSDGWGTQGLHSLGNIKQGVVVFSFFNTPEALRRALSVVGRTPALNSFAWTRKKPNGMIA